MGYEWLDWAKQIQSIAQIGLTYSKDVYDLERFEQLRKLSMEIMARYTETELHKLPNLFAGESGYATPKVDIRAVILKDGQILLVQEKADGAWSLPGGWADIGLTPSEVVVKEVREEAGVDVRFVKLLAVLDTKMHNHPPSPYHVYKMFLHCELLQDQEIQEYESVETSGIRFYDINNLPKLSLERNTEAQVRMMVELIHNNQAQVICD